MTCCSIACLGYATLAYVACRLLLAAYRVIYPFFISTGVKDLVNYSGGKWAVVTGSTDGIGKGYAFELARKGMNVCLIARNKQKLDDTKAEIEAKYPSIDVSTVVFDFTTADVSDYERMYAGASLDEIDVGVLVNNVGRSLEHPEYQLDIVDGLRVSRDTLVINALSVVAMTQLVMPSMRSRGRGVVVNVSSASDMQPTPLLNVYAATKVFVRYVSSALSEEYRTSGVFVQCVSPFFVATKLARIRRATLTAPSGETFARAAVRTIGVVGQTHGYWAHQLQGEVISVMPAMLVQKIQQSLLGGVRAAAIKRKAKNN